MGLLLFFGSLMIAYGPSFAIFALIIWQSPRLLILSIGSAFFWTVGIFASSLVWFIIPPLRDVHIWTILWAVPFQELTRYAYFYIYSIAERGPFSVSSPNHFQIEHLRGALAFGWGISVSYVSIQYTSILWQSLGPGDYLSPGCPSISIFPLSAMFTFCFSLYQIFWTIIAFYGYKTKNWWKIGGVVALHYLASIITLLNAANCCVSFIFTLFVLCFTAGWVWYLVTHFKAPPPSSGVFVYLAHFL